MRARVLQFERKLDAAVWNAFWTPDSLRHALLASPALSPFIGEHAPMPKTSLQQILSPKPAPVLITSLKINAMLEERIIIGAKCSQLEAKKKDIDAKLLPLVQRKANDEDGAIETTDCLAKIIKGSNVSIDAALLMKAGVKASIIKKCTVTKEYRYVRVDRKKDEAAVTGKKVRR